jgi:signal transduction histidine kinase
MSAVQTLRSAWASWWSASYADSARQPLWAMTAVTLLFGTAMAVVLTVFALIFSGSRLDLVRAFGVNFLIAQCIGFAIFGLHMLTHAIWGAARVDGWSAARRKVFFALLPLAGVIIGYAVSLALLGWLPDLLASERLGSFLAGVLLVWAVLTLVTDRFWAQKLARVEAEGQAAAERERAAVLQRQAADAQLRALQAQIEPHFLFNTLANVTGMIEHQPANARRMLERLIALLRASLSASRADQVTLAQELDLCRAYLEIVAIRMAGRLRYVIEADEAVRARPVPPLLLQPLVENAIQHGLEPKVEGGQVRIAVRARADGTLELSVEDDGTGFGAATRGGGVGLANLRDRLRTLDERARLSIEDARPGTRVRIELPPCVIAPAAPGAIVAAASARRQAAGQPGPSVRSA